MNERPVLDSWKEISGYLKRSIRTCQHWEIELGLPIHRIDGTPSARVFAYPDELDRWFAEKAHKGAESDDESERARLKKRTRRLIAVVGAPGILLVGAFFAWRSLISPPVKFPVVNQVVGLTFLPFENVTGDAALEPWGKAVAHLFTTDFLQSRVVAVDTGSGYSVLKKLNLLDAPKLTNDDMKRITGSYKSGYFVTGSLIRSDRDIIINVRVHDGKTQEPISYLRSICRGERGIPSAVDDLTPQIKLALNIPRRLVSHDVDEPISRITTDSLEALKLYCAGIWLEYGTEKLKALELYKKAVAIDPEFAEACYHIFFMSWFFSVGEPKLRDDAILFGKRVADLSDRLNYWTRVHFIDYYFLRFQPNFDRAIVEYKKLLAIAPGDQSIMGALAGIYAEQEEYDKVVALLDNETALEDEPNTIRLAYALIRTNAHDRAQALLSKDATETALIYPLQVCAASQGRWDEALAQNERYRALAPATADTVRRGKAALLIAQDDFANAETELRSVLEKGRNPEKFEALNQLTGLGLTKGQLGEAGNWAKAAVTAAETSGDTISRKRAHHLMANVLYASGDLDEALKEAELASLCYAQDDIYFDPVKKTQISYEQDDISCLRYFHLRAMILLEMGRLDDFDKKAEEIRGLVERSQYPKLMRAYYLLLGKRALKTGDSGLAISYFWKALQLLPSAFGHPLDIDSAQYYYSLADAYERAGRCRSALDLYKKVPSFWEQRPCSGDLYARAFYRMAKIYDQCGRPGKAAKSDLEADRSLAVENYKKFLSLRKDAGAEFADEVGDAQRRLAALDAERTPGTRLKVGTPFPSANGND